MALLPFGKHRRALDERLAELQRRLEDAENRLFHSRAAETVASARAETLARELAEGRSSGEGLAQCLQAAHAGVWSRDIASGRFWWSAELEKTFGIEPGTLGNTLESLLRLVHEGDHRALTDTLDGAARSGSPFAVEFRYRHASGEWRRMEWRGGSTDAGRTLRGIGLDVSTTRRSEAELRLTNEELMEASRRKDAFLTSLAHELRNPLEPIKNSVAVLRTHERDAATVEWAREVIERQVADMARLLDDLLDVSRVAGKRLELERQRIDIGPIVSAAVEAGRPALESAGHQLDLQIPQAPLWVDADPQRLQQVLTILLDNAVRYTERGGRIAVAAVAEDRELVLSVKDTGAGIEPAQLPHVFDLFAHTGSTRARMSGGLGVGLALVKAIVERHSGAVIAYSEGTGRGSEFMVRLPLNARDPVRRAAESPVAPESSATAQRILIADDNPDAAESLALMLGLSGHDVRTARDGHEAVETCEAFRPRVVFLDIGMPRMNGYDAARRIRSEPWGADVVLVALTGWAEDEDKRRAAEAGFDQHLTKPVDPPMLRQILNPS